MDLSVATELEAGRVSREHRADRIEAQALLSRISSLSRVRGCRRVSCLPAGAVNVGAAGSTASGDRRGAFGGLATCGSVWACPECAQIILVERQRELEAAFAEWDARGHQLVLATFTLRHHAGDPLASVWDAVSYAWAAARGGRGWREDQRAYGIARLTVCKAHKRTGFAFGNWGVSCGCDSRKRRIDWVRVVEVTQGANGWHVHVHAALFVRSGLTDLELVELHANMFERWQAACARKGFLALDVNTMSIAADRDTRRTVWDRKLGAYLVKGRYRSAAELAAAELARGDSKKAGGGNRTPFELLASMVGGADSAANRGVWREWEQGSLGRRQVSWSRGLREELIPHMVERTDDEIIADVEAVEPVLSITRAGWRVVLEAGLRAAVLDAVECDDSGNMLADCLDSWGVEWGPAVRLSAC